MGLFDSLQYDTGGYGGQQGGLLDMLRMFQQQQQVQPSQGFPQVEGQAGGQSIGGQMPGAPGQMELPPTSMPTQGQAPQMAQQPLQAQPQQVQPPQGQVPPMLQQPSGGIGDNLMAGLQGFANSKGLLPALANGIQGLATGQRTDPQGMQQQQLRATYQSLLGAGVPQNLAMAAAMNPDVLKTIAPAYFDKSPKLQESGQDPLTGQKSFSEYRPGTVSGPGSLTPLGQNGQSSTGSSGFLAKGIGQVDSSLTGADYLKQFSPEVQAAVTDYVGGKTMPTGNPRQGFTQAVKMIAQKYGNDIGQPADDTTFAARRQMRSKLSDSAPSSLGGQINIGNTAMGHLADLTQKAVDLGNYDAGVSFLSRGVNNFRGMGTDQAAKMDALKGAAEHYGQEITKFYAGSPGGVAERGRFLETVNGAKSPKELAAVLETEAELMHSRLGALGDQIKGVLGPMASEYPVVRPDGEVALKKITANVSKLRGGGEQPQQPAAGPDRSAIEAEMRRRGLMK